MNQPTVLQIHTLPTSSLQGAVKHLDQSSPFVIPILPFEKIIGTTTKPNMADTATTTTTTTLEEKPVPPLPLPPMIVRKTKSSSSMLGSLSAPMLLPHEKTSTTALRPPRTKIPSSLAVNSSANSTMDSEDGSSSSEEIDSPGGGGGDVALSLLRRSVFRS